MERLSDPGAIYLETFDSDVWVLTGGVFYLDGECERIGPPVVRRLALPERCSPTSRPSSKGQWEDDADE